MDAFNNYNKTVNGKKSIPLENTSLLLGVLSCLMFGFFTGIPAVIMGHISLYRIKKQPERNINKRVAMVGTILGYFGILLYVMLALALFLIYSDPKSYWHIF